eukprot:CAMPEP_0119279230 /NCGR_PEP_ID=MMETSP1329-20130426/20431_1 /TAXON_ID=114041 /ORGANISM="Genus nov. species nov., Strain RCC1024" /LENGTH=118 /DNA_ID=CAMNT_0007279765 /DNA_START=73 /DNA_END=426 /DNA_ORIENTATION=+
MAEIVVVRLSAGNGPERLVSVTPGADTEELRALICAAFQLTATPETAPVALIASDTGVLVPISVACQHPETLTAPSYGILCVGGELRKEAPAGRAPPGAYAEEEEEDEDEEDEEDEED